MKKIWKIGIVLMTIQKDNFKKHILRVVRHSTHSEKSELISSANGFHIVHSFRLFVRPFLALVIKNPGRHSG